MTLPRAGPFDFHGRYFPELRARPARAVVTARHSRPTAVESAVPHDRIHAREPTHDRDRWTAGTILATEERDGHWVVTVETPDGESVELVVTFAVRDLVLGRLPTETGESAVGQRVWYRERGGG